MGATTFLLSLFLTWIVRNRFRENSGSTALLIGGIPIASACLVGYAFLVAIGLSHPNRPSLGFILPLFGAALLIFLVGLIADLKRLEPWHRVLFQTIAACLAYWAGVRIVTVGGIRIEFWSLPLTVAWILLCSTAINVVNRIEGLAAGAGVVAACATFVFALLQNDLVLAVCAIPLVAGILGFLPYSFASPTILLGESGSLFIGFMLGCYSILWGQRSGTILSMAVPLLVLTVPLFDTIFIAVRRFLRRQPIGAADHSHIYHRLLSRGLTPRKVMIVLYLSCAMSAIASLFVLKNQSLGLAIVLFCVAAWIWIRHLSYPEFSVARRMLMEGSLRRKLHAEITVRSYESRLNAASTPEEYWAVAVEGLNEFGFYEAQLSIAGTRFEWRCDTPSFSSWEVNVPIAEVDNIRLSRAFNTGAQAHGFAPFIDLLRRSLTVKRGIFLSYNRSRSAEVR